MTSRAAAEALADRGFVVLPSLLSPELCRSLVDALRGMWGDGAAGSGADGLVIRDLERVIPRAIEAVSNPAALAIVHAYLGDEVALEVVAGIVSDRRRPFMPWHSHVGGREQDRLRPRLATLRIERPTRAMILAYPGGCEGEWGPLLVLPRGWSDPLVPPYAVDDPSWPGAVEVHAPPGTVVIADEATFHAVRPQTCDGLRTLVGAYWVRAS